MWVASQSAGKCPAAYVCPVTGLAHSTAPRGLCLLQASHSASTGTAAHLHSAAQPLLALASSGVAQVALWCSHVLAQFKQPPALLLRVLPTGGC